MSVATATVSILIALVLGVVATALVVGAAAHGRQQRLTEAVASWRRRAHVVGNLACAHGAHPAMVKALLYDEDPDGPADDVEDPVDAAAVTAVLPMLDGRRWR